MVDEDESAPTGGPAGGVGQSGTRDRPGAQLPWRIAAFAGALLVLLFLALVVVRRDDARVSADRTPGATVSTAKVLPPRGSGQSVPGPGDSRVRAGTTLPMTSDDLGTRLEKVARRDTGWTHALSCAPAGHVAPWTVVECDAKTAPPIDGVPPSRFLAVVLDDGTILWVRGPETLSAESLRGRGALTCEQLNAGDVVYGEVYIGWVLRGRPADMDPSGAGRPCAGTYPAFEVDGFFAKSA